MSSSLQHGTGFGTAEVNALRPSLSEVEKGPPVYHCSKSKQQLLTEEGPFVPWTYMGMSGDVLSCRSSEQAWGCPGNAEV